MKYTVLVYVNGQLQTHNKPINIKKAREIYHAARLRGDLAQIVGLKKGKKEAI